jgi:2'-5' RNA ligase
MSVIRAFIAIKLSTEIQESLKQVSSQLKKQLQGIPVRWVPVENIHLTIKFLGNVSNTNLEVLKRILETECSRLQPFEISVGELGAFPNSRRPRVAWVKVQAPRELFTIQRGIEEESTRLGYAREKREFKPHLTLGRVSRNASSDDVRGVGKALDTYNVGFLGAMWVKSVNLFRSDLKPSGAIYTSLYTANLKPFPSDY